MKIIPSKNFVRDLRKTKDKRLLQRVAEVVAAIEAAESVAEIAHLEKLEGFKTAYRIRIGNYRLGCLWEGDTVILARFLHRKDIYRSFPGAK